MTISNVFVESLPNREIFEEVYPESDTDQSDSNDDDDWQPRWKESDGLKDAKEKLTKLQDARRLADETVASAESRLKLLDAYGKTMDRKRNVVIEESLATYKEQRAKAYEDYMQGLQHQRDTTQEITDVADEVVRLQKEDDKLKAKAEKERQRARRIKQKDQFRKARHREERTKEKKRVRTERENFWPKFCWAVHITLETDAPTPMSSRRTSVSSDTKIARHIVPDDKDTANVDLPAPSACDLVLSYATTSAYWAPRYDLQLSTTNATGTLSFDAELHNSTCETWSNCKVALSTSQATFSALDDTIPTLNPWYLNLAQGNPPFNGDAHEQVLRTEVEINSTNEYFAKQKRKQAGSNRPRYEMFGLSHTVQTLASFQAQQDAADERRHLTQSLVSAPPPPPLVQPCAAPAPVAPSGGPSLFGAADVTAKTRSVTGFGAPKAFGSNAGFGGGGGGLFGGSAAPAAAAAAPGASFGGAVLQRAMPRMRKADRGGGNGSDSEEADEGFGLFDEGSARPDSPPPESVMEETGLTSTYELPGLKTLAPKSTSSKQRVAHIHFSNVAYSHTVVAKYKPAAYLKAKIKNTGKMTLFKGRAGLTLDGSFLGRTTLPRCSAGETFTLSLGIDPAITVTYPKPYIQRATAGLFSKENTAIYTRTVTLHNTRASAGKPVSVLVLDQVPMSQDEKLRVEVLTPQGMRLGGGDVRAGAPGLETRDNRDWGSAAATLKKNGEMNWLVALNAGKAVKLTLEYGVAFPNGTYPYSTTN